MDYEDTFALIAKTMTFCNLVVVSSIRQWKIYQIDVKNELLNVKLHEEIYMSPPHVLITNQSEVCWLHKAFYGLQQPSCVWFEKISTIVSLLGFRSSIHDSTFFFLDV